MGVAAALWPMAWLRLFGDDAAMMAMGAAYLRIVGPFYGFFGFGLALYFASQGAGRVGWPLAAGILRVLVSLGGGMLALRLGWGTSGLFLALGIGLSVMGLANAASLAFGAWLPRPRSPTPVPFESDAGRTASASS